MKAALTKTNITQKVSQIRTKATQQAAKVTGGERFSNFLLAIVLIVMPVLSAYITIETIDVAKKPIDATTDAKVKEVHDRHLIGIPIVFLLYASFLTICYTQRDNIHKIKFFNVFFIFVNMVIAFILMVFAADAMTKIKDAGKEEEYKKYINMLNMVVAAGVVIIFLMAVWWFVSPTASKPPQAAAKPQQVAKKVD